MRYGDYRLKKESGVGESEMKEEFADKLLSHFSEYSSHGVAVSSRQVSHYDPRLGSNVYSDHVLQ